MTGPALSSLEAAFQGVFPTTLATCSATGTVNLIFVSQVHYVDDEHVAFSEQFLNRTLANLKENPRAQSWLIDPASGRQFRLDLVFVRRESEGPLVSRMRAKLEGIAASTGMSDVFRLRAALVCRVLAVREVIVRSAAAPPAAAPRRTLRIGAFGELAAALERAQGLEAVCSALLDGLSRWLDHPHSVLWLLDESAQALVAVDSRGFVESGVGSEVLLGHGLVGQCAAKRQPIRIGAMSRERIYARAADPDAREIGPPRLAGAESFLAVPLVAKGRLLGVLAVEAIERTAFGDAEEEALRLVGHLASSAIALAHEDPQEPDSGFTDRPLHVRYYAEDDSVFVDDVYVVKGAAGRILWVILDWVTTHQRTELTNRELRLDPRVALPALHDNLEARLLLLRRRLEERCPRLRLPSSGRGRFRVECSAPPQVEVVPTGRR